MILSMGCYIILGFVITCYDLLHVWQGIQVDVEAEVRTLDRLQLDRYDHIVALRLMGNRNEPLRRFPGMFNVCLNIKTTIGDNCQLQTDSRILRMMWVESQYSTPQHGCLDRRTTDFFILFWSIGSAKRPGRLLLLLLLLLLHLQCQCRIFSVRRLDGGIEIDRNRSKPTVSDDTDDT